MCTEQNEIVEENKIVYFYLILDWWAAFNSDC